MLHQIIYLWDGENQTLLIIIFFYLSFRVPGFLFESQEKFPLWMAVNLQHAFEGILVGLTVHQGLKYRINELPPTYVTFQLCF
jgi:hypothetical protein